MMSVVSVDEFSVSAIYLNSKRGNIGNTNMREKYRRTPDGWVIQVYWLGDAAMSVLPLGRRTDTSPILSQRYT